MQIVVELVAEVRMLELAAAVKRYLKVSNNCTVVFFTSWIMLILTF